MTNTLKNSGIVPILPSRNIFFRENGKRTWKRYTLTILGKKTYLDPVRSLKPMQLTLETDVDGFYLVDVVGLDLFSAIASALLSVESIILLLGHSGEVRLNKAAPFDIETDTVFFSGRIEKLQRTLNPRKRSKGKPPGTAPE